MLTQFLENVFDFFRTFVGLYIEIRRSMFRLIFDIEVCVGAVISLNFDCFSNLTRVSETRSSGF